MKSHTQATACLSPFLPPSPRPGPIRRINAISKDVAYHLETVFLFTKSDIKTTVIPVSILAIGTAPLCSSQPIEHALKAIFWLWMILLQFNLFNQTISPEEDAENKPWRPIPSGRISLRNAIIARWISIPACAMLSSYFASGSAVLIPCILFTVLVFMYNFFDCDKNGFAKSLFNGFGYSMMALGTSLVASSGSLFKTLNWKNFPELTLFFFVISTTIHAQDFQDVEGDREVGRNTIPMMLPNISRISMPILLPLWSAIVISLSHPPSWLAAVYLGLSILVSFRFLCLREVKNDEWTYVLYNAWLSLTIVHMGLYKRYSIQVTPQPPYQSIPFSGNITVSGQAGVC
ncbi:UbiA prenyltransferase family-domain-containing protein [Ephemerocybe angulata]|uniref:UbiA prenyltransferase family-domain-containing protein n=1 Tax=Ephemerocybe angulata TaxID=980116 RepID=A0A8H6M5P7_9AGAR|nr:UbiA prenyltransferase family-domain-containing protein [Tulosesus angulatus]